MTNRPKPLFHSNFPDFRHLESSPVSGPFSLLSVGNIDEFIGFKVKLKVSDLRFRGSQRSQYPLIKEYTLNHNIKAPII